MVQQHTKDSYILYLLASLGRSNVCLVCLYYQLEQEPCQHREQHLLSTALKAKKQSTPLSKDTCTFSPFWKRTRACFRNRTNSDTNRR